jgi:hypothetical protein
MEPKVAAVLIQRATDITGPSDAARSSVERRLSVTQKLGWLAATQSVGSAAWRGHRLCGNGFMNGFVAIRFLLSMQSARICVEPQPRKSDGFVGCRSVSGVGEGRVTAVACRLCASLQPRASHN